MKMAIWARVTLSFGQYMGGTAEHPAVIAYCRKRFTPSKKKSVGAVSVNGARILVGSVVLSPEEPPPLRVTEFTCGVTADVTFALTVILGKGRPVASESLRV